MLLFVGGLIFADDCLGDISNTRKISDGIIPKRKVESTTSYVFTFNDQSEITKTKNSI
jgi:hypothetical protein